MEHRPHLCPRRSCLKSSPCHTPPPTPLRTSPSHDSPRVPSTASALPIPPPLSRTASDCSRKSVSFCAPDNYDVWDADDWDRTPTEPARKLSYQDLLELKAIQRQLPHANQPPDPYTSRPASHYLGKVPIGLLPLVGEGSAPNRYPDVVHSEVSLLEKTAGISINPTSSPRTPSSPPPDREWAQKRGFSFMPLLGGGEPQPPNKDTPFSHSRPIAIPAKKKRNVMYINGEEVDLDEDEEDEPAPPPRAVEPPIPTPTLLPACTFKAKRPVEQPNPAVLPACSFKARPKTAPTAPPSSSSSLFPFPPASQPPRIATSASSPFPFPPNPTTQPMSPPSISPFPFPPSPPTSGTGRPTSPIAAKTIPAYPPIPYPSPTSSRIGAPPRRGSFSPSTSPSTSRTSPRPSCSPTSPNSSRIVRTVMDNPNPSGMVALSGWAAGHSGRTSPVLVQRA